MVRVLAYVLLAAVSAGLSGPAGAVELLFDHRHTDLLLDPGLVHAARDSVRVLFVRLSHGRQITVGLERIADDDFAVCLAYDSLSVQTGALCVYNSETLPYDFWLQGGADSVRAMLDDEPRINMFLYEWCTHLNTYGLADVDLYLASMDSLEAEYPGVVFAYSTGTAEEQGGYGFNRYLCNLKIRNHCLIRGKLLYDFADIESWYLGERAMYDHEGVPVPYLHPDLFGDDAEHASFLNCEYKAMAFWQMVVSTVYVLGVGEEENGGETPRAQAGVRAWPNPFNPGVTISFGIDECRGPERVVLEIYDAAGRRVSRLADGLYAPGSYREYWDGLSEVGTPAASGVYFYRLKRGKDRVSGKLVLTR